VVSATHKAYLDAMGIDVWVDRYTQMSTISAQEKVNPAAKIMTVTDASKEHSTQHKDKTTATLIQKTLASVDESFMPAPPEWFEQIPESNELDYSGLEGAEFDADAEFDEPSVPSVETLDWPALQACVMSCEQCELSQNREKAIFGFGDKKADVMLIGDAPNIQEERLSEPFVGDVGQLLSHMLFALGLARDKVYLTNVVKCRVNAEQEIKSNQLTSCHAYLKRQISLIEPKVIVLVGRVAAQSLLQSELGLAKLRLMNKTFGDKKIPFVASYHPAYLLRSSEQKQKAWQDFQKIADFLELTDAAPKR